MIDDCSYSHTIEILSRKVSGRRRSLICRRISIKIYPFLRTTTGLVILVLFLNATLTLNCVAALPSEANLERSTLEIPCPTGEAFFQTDARVLEPGSPIERELAGGEAHSYLIALTAGQYLCMVADQRSVDVTARVFGPTGQQLLEVNNVNDLQESEELSVVAVSSGVYRLEVRAARKDPARGVYAVRIRELRGATPQDDIKIAAERVYTEGRRLFFERTGDALHSAVKKYEEALSLYRTVSDHNREVHALNAIGETYQLLGEERKALAIFGEAFPLSQSLEDLRVKAKTRNNFAGAYNNVGERQKALEHFSEALLVWRAIGDRRAEAVTLSNMGLTYHELDELQKALECQNQALEIFRKLKDRRGESTTLNNLGSVYRDLGEYQKALDHFFQMFSLVRGYQYGEAVALFNIGTTYYFSNDPSQAVKYLEQALSLHQATGNRFGEAETLIRIGTSYSDLGNSQKALEHLNRALTISSEIGIRSREASANYSIGIIYSSKGDQAQASEYFHQALLLSRRLGNLSLEASSLLGLAHVERSRGNLAEARIKTEAGLEIIESLRIKVASRDFRTSYFASNKDAYDFYTDLLMQSHEREPSAGYDAAGFVASERARARSLLESLTEARANIRHGADPALLDRERSTQLQLNAKAESLTQLLSGKHTEGQAAEARQELESLVTNYQQVEAEIRKNSPRYAALTQPQPLHLRTIQTELVDTDTLLLEYSLGKDRSFLWAVTPTSFTSHVLPKRADIEAAARRIHVLLTARNDWPAGETPEQRLRRVAKADAEYPQAASAFSRTLLGPVAGELGTKRLLLVIEDALHYIPFGALPAPSSSPSIGKQPALPLIVNHEIVVLPSASTLALLRRDFGARAPAPKGAAILADPVFSDDDPRVKARKSPDDKTKASPDERSTRDVERSARESGFTTLRRLPFSRQEADAIEAMGSQSLKATDFAASRATATSSELGQYRIIHFATHGLLNSQHPELSGIVLSLINEHGQPQDGFLRLHDIYNLQLKADLVVLSACETALGKEIKGEGLIGLTRGFMYAGAPRVVASLWKVEDRATAELMKKFYRGMLKEGKRPAAALRDAQVEMWSREGWQAPYFWAAFTLQGEWK